MILSLKEEVSETDTLLGFYNDVIRVFNKEPEAGLDRWICDDLFEDVKKKLPQYYLPHVEAALISKNLTQICDHLSNSDILIELGSGAHEVFFSKTQKILSNLPHINKYFPIEICEESLEDTIKHAKIFNSSIEVKGLLDDFFKDSWSYLTSPETVVVCFGNTLGNVPERLNKPAVNLQKKLQQIRNNLPKGAKFLIGYDCNPNQQDILRTYGNDIFEEYVLNVFHKISSKVATFGFNASDFRCETTWHPQSFACIRNAVLLRDVSFLIGKKHFSFKQGDSFPFAYSYKYPVSYFSEVAKKANFESVDAFIDDSKRVALQLFEAT